MSRRMIQLFDGINPLRNNARNYKTIDGRCSKSTNGLIKTVKEMSEAVQCTFVAGRVMQKG